MKVFFGKFGAKYPEQIEHRFYAGGEKGSDWYGGVQEGDFIFPIYKGRISEVWQAEAYTIIPNKINKDGVLTFKKINEFPEVAVSTEFLRYKYFSLDLNMVNKSIKSAKCGFFEITFDKPIPDINQINFSQKRNIYIVDQNPVESISYQDEDIRILVDEDNQYKIKTIEVFRNNSFNTYEPLWNLYIEKNKPEERYSLFDLLSYAKEDGANKKEYYIKAVIDELKTNGIFKAVSPVAIYDDIIVGRKKTYTKKKDTEPTDNDEEQIIIDEESTANYENYKRLLEDNPNLILFGPPGTGKTYTAQRIIEYMEKEATGKSLSFEQISNDERIKFITFHQSYSYEEFVEGVRPVFSQENDTFDANGIQYNITNGILKELAERAALSQISESTEIKGKTSISKNSQIYKISLGKRNSDEHIYNECIKNNYIAIGWFDENIAGWDYDKIYSELQNIYQGENPTNDASSVDLFLNQINIGDIVLVYDSPFTIRDVGVVDGDYQYNDSNSNFYYHRRNVKWIKHFDIPYDILDLNGGIRLTLKTVYQLNRIQFSDIKELLSFDDKEKPEEKILLPCYLIIDEINRGNISKIFGELITLIEKDKRNKLKITLPYSRKPFRLPANIYIIGTMNTADRSIAILDTALRRRFTFVELEPDSNVIRISDSGLVEDEIDLSRLMESINKRILKKYDRDHRIGHSYFLNLDSFSKFRDAWEFKIIPLLMDYFYNDAKSVAEIIGELFIDPNTGEVNHLQKSDFIEAVKAIYT